ncbi:hypothetical protein A5714_04240 [Mycobacterium sp. E2462]|nr:hypothetical protein A5714_04240 [Mycobacterium sp. E2462]
MRGNTVLAEHADGGVLRVDENTGRGIALSTDASGRYTKLDPYTGAQLALAEAYRNVAVTGATPVAVTNCLNFGSPEDPGVMWQFSEAVRGLADGCVALGIPVTGGNVSFYNQTGSAATPPAAAGRTAPAGPGWPAPARHRPRLAALAASAAAALGSRSSSRRGPRPAATSLPAESR